MIRASQPTLRGLLFVSLAAAVVIVSIWLGGSPRDLLLVVGAAVATLLCVSLVFERPAMDETPTAHHVAPWSADDVHLMLRDGSTTLPEAARRTDQSSLDQSVSRFQKECGELLLDAETARVQTESCEGGVRAVDQASRSLAATCDVLGRRAGLTQSHALMARCAMADAAECLRQAIECAQSWQNPAKDDVPAQETARPGGAAIESLGRATDAMNVALERGDEAARVAAELGGAASRGQRNALNLSEACAGLAPSLDESARTGMRLAMLAASLDESAGRVARMLGAAATDQRWKRPQRAAVSWKSSAAGNRAPVTGEDGNVVWVRFQGTRGKPGVEQA